MQDWPDDYDMSDARFSVITWDTSEAGALNGSCVLRVNEEFAQDFLALSDCVWTGNCQHGHSEGGKCRSLVLTPCANRSWGRINHLLISFRIGPSRASSETKPHRWIPEAGRS